MKEEINKIQENVKAQNFEAQIVLTETEYKKIMYYNFRLQERIDKAIEYIKKYERIKAYYEYVDEDGYDEYNYDEDFKEELLEILGDKE